jgi:hypothetical protein
MSIDYRSPLPLGHGPCDGHFCDYIVEWQRLQDKSILHKGLFADIYDRGVALLPVLDLANLLHFCPLTTTRAWQWGLEDDGVFALPRSKRLPGGWPMFYKRSRGFHEAHALVQPGVAGDRLSFEEHYKDLLGYQASKVVQK